MYEMRYKVIILVGICKTVQECDSFAKRKTYQHKESSGINVFTIVALCS